MTINIVYFHGYGSRFDLQNDKVQELSSLGKIFGIDIDYSEDAKTIVDNAKEYSINVKADLIVGTSMGGWLASHVAARLGIPFVAINPALNPEKTLINKIGINKDYYGKEIILTKSAVSSYIPFNLNGCGLILLDEGDEHFDSHLTKKLLEDYYSIKMFPQGNHRFLHIKESIEYINNFLTKALLFYGVEID
jgi:predicted esterase YcpF (UPF0227 family)